MIKYSVAMAIRLLCIFAMLFVQGWWLAVCAVGAIVLPYIAVVLANVSGPSLGRRVERPGTVVPVSGTGAGSGSGPGSRTQGDPTSGAGTGERSRADHEQAPDDAGRMPRGDDDRNAA